MMSALCAAELSSRAHEGVILSVFSLLRDRGSPGFRRSSYLSSGIFQERRSYVRTDLDKSDCCTCSLPL